MTGDRGRRQMRIKVKHITAAALILSLAAPVCGQCAEKTFDEFRQSLADALNARDQMVQERLSELSESGAGSSELMQLCIDAANGEWELLQEYEESSFGEPDSDEEAVRAEYLSGLKLQTGCSGLEGDVFWEQWEQGFAQRASAVVEIVDVQGASSDIGESILSEMRESTGAVCENGSAAAYFVQAFLALPETNYMEVSEIDGILGQGTRKSLRAFLSAQGVEPVSCVINEAWIAGLVQDGVISEPIFSAALQTLADTGHSDVVSFTYESMKSASQSE